jgi:hypothetical protein
MTINEIQSTLDQLKQRHPGLDESLISTLLEAGGWDDKEIAEAKTLFRSQKEEKSFPHEDQVFLPENPELFLEEHNKGEDGVSIAEKTSPQTTADEVEISKEKQSLVKEDDAASHEETPIPHNLPLKPFEASPHVWQFSRYKDVFYGDSPQKSEPKEVVEEKPKEIVKEVAPSPVPELIKEKVQDVPPVKIVETPVPRKVPETVPAKVPLTKGDESIIALGAMLAFVVILLAIYMYSHGRL